MYKFVVCAPNYDANSGGSIALHNLAVILSELGQTVYLAHNISSLSWSPFKKGETLRFFRYCIKTRRKQIKIINSTLVTSVSAKDAYGLASNPEYIFIYPESVLGNPYDAINVVRWLLHYPMFFRSSLMWSSGDIIASYGNILQDQKISGTIQYPYTLTVTSFPKNIYLKARMPKRSGSAFMIRKGTGKPFIHPKDAVCIDNMTHEQAAKTLGEKEFFYCYDSYTAYSYFASLAGCTSIVVPDSYVSIDEWRPDTQSRCGIAYGVENVPFAISTAHLVLPWLEHLESESQASVSSFLDWIRTNLANKAEIIRPYILSLKSSHHET
jgi:hypothetical protein